ncbi:uncharacterized protein [Physcomitrium patens]|uniref:R3H domain-containing protein n=2 Tax=Physcomitrium patens TaxID=3218 RepID=A0A2K1K5N2_PHYPA|nr:uncharacterized protein LOC112285600 isoform X1 [Physcomitrium patens]PNR49086.1 hypothetical protein PHYPA_010982 [Physcomitrium patens]|eukprot:XP_024382314.1 uncharacterized protein LOC112285600 isoform X1 [Physcomitrella patens]
MRVGRESSEIEELAWLVKDNLYTKHLVLSAEELFVEFLQPDYGGGASLELEPMLSYQRMLLHRLADCFGLVHESVGEGENRRIIIEKCEESKIPLMLITDVLESSYGEVHAPSNRQLLLRSPNEIGDQTNKSSLRSPALSLEEREAAYQAARERIFSDVPHSADSLLDQRETQRARPVPVVARRMIAHALGKPQVLSSDVSPNDAGSALEDLPVSALKEAPSHTPAKAARRMLTQALGFPLSSPSSRGPERRNAINQNATISVEATLRHNNAPADVVSCATGTPPDDLKASDTDEALRLRSIAAKDVDSCGANHQTSRVMPTRPFRKDRAGAAAGRMFAQALGLPHNSPQPVVADCFADGMALVETDSGGGNESLINHNVLYIAEESVTSVNQSAHLVGSARKASDKRERKEKSKLEPSKPDVLKEDQRKGGKGHKFEKHLRLKTRLIQEDQETGEVFLTHSRVQ